MRKPTLMVLWEGRGPAVADDARRLAAFVNGLPKFDPIYESWLRSPKAKKPVLTLPMSVDQAGRFLVDNMQRYDVSNEPWPEIGRYFGAGHARPPPHDFRESSYADTKCSIGGHPVPDPDLPIQNHLEMRLSAIRPSTGRAWTASELRPLMRFLRELWRPAEMYASMWWATKHLPEIPNPRFPGATIPLRPYTGWITYLPAEVASRLRPPEGVHVDPFDDGAVLLTVNEEPFEPTDVEPMARFKALQEVMRPFQN